MSNQLEVWASEYDAVICYGKDDIASAMIESDCGYEEGDREMLVSDVEDGQFERTPDDKRIGIMQTSDSDMLQKVPVMSVVPITDKDGLYIFQYRALLTAAQWVKIRGRGHLYTTEY